MRHEPNDACTSVLQLHPHDIMAVVVVGLAGCASVPVGPATLIVRGDIPTGHQGAPRTIAQRAIL